MAINLVKGQTEAISTTITKLKVGLGWEPNVSLSNKEFDLDVSAFMLGENGKIINENYLIFYNSELRVDPNKQNSLQPKDSIKYPSYYDNEEKKNIDSNEHHRRKTRPIDPDFSTWGSLDDMDGKTSDGGDDETMNIDLNKISPLVKEIVIVASIYEFDLRKQNFGQVDDSYISIYDELNDNLLYKYELNEDFSTNTAIEFCRIYRRGLEWKVQATGIGHNDGLNNLIAIYI
jgi:tellurium resistance protein TerD